MTKIYQTLWPIVMAVASVLAIVVVMATVIVDSASSEGTGEVCNLIGVFYPWYIGIGFLFAVAFFLNQVASKKRIGLLRNFWLVALIAVCIWTAVSGLLFRWGKIKTGARMRSAEQAATRTTIQNTHLMVQLYSNDFGRIPTEQEGLNILIDNQEGSNYSWNSEIPCDTWRNPLQYSVRDGKPVIWSLGEDGKPGTRDDIFPDADFPVPTN
ncbi:type II secretion system protein GspG [Verrucomicrobiota bacterium]